MGRPSTGYIPFGRGVKGSDWGRRTVPWFGVQAEFRENSLMEEEGEEQGGGEPNGTSLRYE